MEKLQQLSQSLTEREEGKEVAKAYAVVMAGLQEYESQKVEEVRAVATPLPHGWQCRPARCLTRRPVRSGARTWSPRHRRSSSCRC